MGVLFFYIHAPLPSPSSPFLLPSLLPPSSPPPPLFLSSPSPMQDIQHIHEFLQELNGNLSTITSLCLFLFVGAAIGCE